ncbi:MAG: DegQ family serine endoprotease [Deltaproteobacteria bacterium]|nr:DegQ family serine endoprotease [Deltaproteobacteria bacterium]MBW2134082.1 DegQ family serine endoprotease [Deltaproteobacteria bacterium]
MICTNRNFKLLVSTLVMTLLVLGAALWAGSQPLRAALAPESFADLARQASPAVVNISTEKTHKGGGRVYEFFGPSPFGREDPFRDFFEKFFGDIPKDFKQRSLGSGFIIDGDGFIITNNHVVEGADKIKVKLIDGREFAATIKGRDPKTDLALIKLSSAAHDLPVLTLGDSDSVRVGDWVLAVGNPFGLGHTVTQGIISAKSRVIGAGPYDDFLQTDASINPGNSGGPLLNLNGEVIGINTAILATGQGIGFATPSSIAKEVIPQLKAKGKVTRGLLGVHIQVVTPSLAKSFGLAKPYGALVAEVNPGSPAAQAGIQRGDIIVAYNGQEIKEMHELPRLVAHTTPGTKATLKVIRQGKEKTVSVVIGELKDEQQAKESKVKTPESELGMVVQELTPVLAQRFRLRDTTGVVVLEVERGSPAAEAGIRPGDLIMEINTTKIKRQKDYHKAISGLKKGAVARLLIKRQGRTLFVSLEIP